MAENINSPAPVQEKKHPGSREAKRIRRESMSAEERSYLRRKAVKDRRYERSHRNVDPPSLYS